VKYSKQGGEVKVVAGRDGVNGVLLSVIDQGAGIAGSDLPRIFERFYRADKARSRELGGTGLGLSIVKHIVQLHGGSIRAESQLGHGTTIQIYLPLERGDNSSPAAAGTAVPGLPEKRV
jgi:signal transduction histidine kinase